VSNVIRRPWRSVFFRNGSGSTQFSTSDVAGFFRNGSCSKQCSTSDVALGFFRSGSGSTQFSTSDVAGFFAMDLVVNNVVRRTWRSVFFSAMDLVVHILDLVVLKSEYDVRVYTRGCCFLGPLVEDRTSTYVASTSPVRCEYVSVTIQNHTHTQTQSHNHTIT